MKFLKERMCQLSMLWDVDTLAYKSGVSVYHVEASSTERFGRNVFCIHLRTHMPESC